MRSTGLKSRHHARKAHDIRGLEHARALDPVIVDERPSARGQLADRHDPGFVDRHDRVALTKPSSSSYSTVWDRP